MKRIDKALTIPAFKPIEISFKLETQAELDGFMRLVNSPQDVDFYGDGNDVVIDFCYLLSAAYKPVKKTTRRRTKRS